MKQSKNSRNSKTGVQLCSYCGKDLNAVIMATMKKKANGYYGFKKQYKRVCCV